ncbi:MAG: Hydroxymethylglutaryl-CoA synthase [Rhodanobacteraceae bacterium]|jgi:hydroxymethylglutaryl-CoA synthase|nr:MAG: Hydroxymethylglutaryl-CoA synthase [Rhodanobacteraceae bacterium]
MNPPGGISGMAVYLPPYRIDLEQWSGWTGNDAAKTRAVVGHGFRMPGPDQNVYTLAANAVLRLIDRYDVDPRRVGYLALGTESSIDNAAGAVIVRGLVDRALQAEGKPALARDCEVPEFKHACLGGVYALKGGLRYLACDGRDRQAIVVSADIAEYARGSSGEPTQGAGAVAMLMEAPPRLLTLDLAMGGSASDYRGLDFRKPFLRFAGQTPGRHGRLNDLPVFNGKYSTDCYTEATLRALDAMFARRGGSRSARLRDAAAVFMHRPYHHMPRNAWALAYLAALAHDAMDDSAAAREWAGYCDAAKVAPDDAAGELFAAAAACEADTLPPAAYSKSMAVLKAFRASDAYKPIVDDKLRLGSSLAMELGNLYTAALPAWLAAGLEDAAIRDVALDDRELLVLGYGSGDAAEAIPARVVAGWREAARAIRFDDALAGAFDLDREQYETLHDTGTLDGADLPAPAGVVIDHVGAHDDHAFQDYGIAYYRYCGRP